MKQIKHVWRKYSGWCTKHSGMLILRVVLGLFFLTHGVLKLQDMGNTTLFFESIGFSAFFAWTVSLIEVIGGAAIVLGVFTCVAGVLLAIIQLVAVYKVTGTPEVTAAFGSFSAAFAFGYGMNLVLAAAALSIGFTGPGRYALWRGRCCGNCRKDKGDGDCEHCSAGSPQE